MRLLLPVLFFLFAHTFAIAQCDGINLGPDISTCEGEVILLDANCGDAATYQWFINGEVFFGETQSTLSVTQDGLYKVEAFMGIDFYEDEVMVVFNETPTPTDPVTDYFLCDSDNDGFAIFDLASKDDEILNTQVDVSIAYFEALGDANSNQNPIVNPTAYSSGNTVIWARVTNNNSCFTTVSFNLIVEVIGIVEPTPLEVCDDNNDGFAIFDLTLKDDEIINGASDIEITYYETLLDAQNATNTILGPYQILTQFQQTIFVRATNVDTGCFVTTQLDLIVNETLILTTPDNIIIEEENSDGFATFDLTINDATITNGEPDLQVLYFEAEANAQNFVNPIANPSQFNNTTNHQTIYASAQNVTTGCQGDVVQFTLIVQDANQQGIEFFQAFAGQYDYYAIGNTLNPEENGAGGGSCFLLSESSATLDLTEDQEVIAAYLYWSGSGEPDEMVTLNSTTINADRTFTQNLTNVGGSFDFFTSITDVTALVTNEGAGVYTFSDLDLDATLPQYCTNATNYGGWSLIVIYEGAFIPIQRIAIFDGFELVSNANPQLDITLNNIDVASDNQSRIGFLAWEGDSALAINETLQINGSVISNPPLNPANNVFNGTNSYTGTTDLFNMDLDFYSLEGIVQPGDTTLDITLTTGADAVFVNNIITVINESLDTDGDGIADFLEDLNNNGDFADDDTDDDGIPNYLDSDDDGDNVPTEIEIEGIGAGLAPQDFIDTDVDDIQNYLDDDDDGDGVLTKDEDYNNNGSPLDDDTDNSGVPDFLESNVFLGLNDFNFSNVSLIPNPAQDKVTVSWSKDTFVKTINVFSIIGELVQQNREVLNVSEVKISLGDMASGVYFVQLVAQDGNVSTRKLIKK